MTITADMPGQAGQSPSPILDFERDYAAKRRRSLRTWTLGTLIFLCVFALTSWLGDFFKVTQVTLPDGSRDWRWIIPAGLPRLGDYISQTIPVLHWDSLDSDLANWFWRWKIWMNLLLETILIAFMATTFGVIGGFLLSFPASRNLAPNKWVLWITRRYLEIARTVPELVWALIFVFCFSVGPLAGVLAIGLHATGALGKLYSEVNENIDMRPLEGVKAAGGSWFDDPNGLPGAVALVSSNPAKALGLTDRGRIEVGLIADLAFVEGGPLPRVTATMRAGRMVHSTGKLAMFRQTELDPA